MVITTTFWYFYLIFFYSLIPNIHESTLSSHCTTNVYQIKGEEDLKASLDGSLKSIPDQLRKDLNQCKLQEAVSVISNLPVQIEARLQKLQSELCEALTKQIEVYINDHHPCVKPNIISFAFELCQVL